LRRPAARSADASWRARAVEVREPMPDERLVGPPADDDRFRIEPARALENVI
jgi:hypothetical protein